MVTRHHTTVLLRLHIEYNILNRVLGDDVKGVDDSRKVSKEAECNVNEGLRRAQATLDPNWERWEYKSNNHKNAVTEAATHGLIRSL